MDADRELAKTIASISTSRVNGTFYRHVKWKYRTKALDGFNSGGRWGPPGAFPVIYLSQPEDSCVVEAYRWLVDPVIDGPPPPIRPRALITAQVDATNVLDLRTATARMTLGLVPAVLDSPAGDAAAYGQCQHIAVAAHQLGRHGIIAPAAGQSGLTLALFADCLPEVERPKQLGPPEFWEESETLSSEDLCIAARRRTSASA